MKRGLTVQQKKVAYEIVQADVTGKTHKEIAEEYGINERTIYKWKNDPDFAKELEELADVNMKSFYAEATQQLKNLVRNGNSEQAVLGAIKLVLQTQGKLRDVQDINANVNTDIKANGLSIADMEEIQRKLNGETE